MLQAARVATPTCVATGRSKRERSGPPGVPSAPGAAIPTRRGPGGLRGLKGQGELQLRKDGASQASVATAERPPVEATVPLADMLERHGEAGETLRQQLERRWKLEFAPDSESGQPKKIFIRRRSTAAVAASVAQPRSRSPSPMPQRSSGSPGPSGRADQTPQATTRARAAGSPAAAASSRAKKSRRERSSLPVLAPRATRDGADETVRQEVLERGQEKEYITLAQEAFRLENLAEKLRDQLEREPTLEEQAEAAGMTVNNLEARLARGREARDAMVQHNLRLVASIARKYSGNNVPFQDLMQEGSVGLLKGLAKFDLRRGYKFSTYCHWWIRQAITRALSDQSRTVRIPIHVYDSLARIRKTTKSLESALGREPTFQEVSDEMNRTADKGVRFTADKVEKIISLGRDVASADALVVSNTGRGRGKQMTTLLDTLVSNDGPDESLLDAGFLISDINSLIHTLEPLERDVLRMHYGLQGDDAGDPRDGPLTFTEIGRRLGLSKDRARSIASAGLQKLREPSRCRSLISYV